MDKRYINDIFIISDPFVVMRQTDTHTHTERERERERERDGWRNANE